MTGRTLDVNGRPVQPVFTAPATQPANEDGPRLVARDALITELTSEDIEVGEFNPFFFGASTDQDLPRGEFLDGSFPAELATVRSFRADRVEQQQLVLALGQFRADQGTATTPAQADLGTQRLHTQMTAQVYYTQPGASDTSSPEISRVEAFIEPQGEDVVFFEVDADESATRVYILFRNDEVDSGAWTGLDLNRAER